MFLGVAVQVFVTRDSNWWLSILYSSFIIIFELSGIFFIPTSVAYHQFILWNLYIMTVEYYSHTFSFIFGEEINFLLFHVAVQIFLYAGI